MRILVLVIIGLLAAGQAEADRNRHDSRWQGYQSHLSSHAEKARAKMQRRHQQRSVRRAYSSARLNWLQTTGLNSGVCDELKDSSLGLRMMCVAFCELQSCSPDYSLDNPFQNCSRSSKWILARYEKRRGPGDPDMPCVKQPEVVAECPCWTREELAGFRGQGANDRVASCSVDVDYPGSNISNYDTWQIFSDPNGPSPYMTSLASFGSYGPDGAPSCSVADTCDPATEICLGESRMMSITSEQLAACEADVAMAAADRGLACN